MPPPKPGALILADGGNALEAMVAMAASIAAVYPHMNHVGGDGFWVVREPNGRVRAIMAPGPAGAKATIGFYQGARLRHDPAARAARGAHRAGRDRRLDAGACRRRNRCAEKCRSMCCSSPRSQQARDGYVVTRSQHELTRDKLPEMGEAPGFAQTFLIDGKVPEQGATMKQPAFAATLDHLAKAGLEDFYRGDVGREIAADLERIGSPVTRADLEKYRAYIAEPLSVKLDVGTLYNAPPPTQGLASLIILALFERLRVAEAESFDFVHGLVESTKRAFRVRDRVVTDPKRIEESLDRYLSRGLSRCRGAEDRTQESRALAGATGQGRHGLDGRGRRFRPRRLLYPVDLLGIRLRLRAAAHRRADAEPRRQLLAR